MSVTAPVVVPFRITLAPMMVSPEPASVTTPRSFTCWATAHSGNSNSTSGSARWNKGRAWPGRVMVGCFCVRGRTLRTAAK